VPDVLDSPFQELDADLRRLESLVALLRKMREFSVVQSPNLPPTGDFEAVALGVKEEICNVSPHIPVLSGTLLLYLAGRFEHFVRISFQSLAEAMAAKCQSLGDLPQQMQKDLRYFTAEISMHPQKYGFDALQANGFLAAYAANLSAASGLGPINSACISVTSSNMTNTQLSDLYKRLGITGIWADLGKQADIKVLFATADDQTAQNQAKVRLDDLMATRNKIAHPTASPSFPDPEAVGNFIGFIRVLATTLTAVSRIHLTAFSPV
jgi:RiboL-PSP-HEPN